MKITLPKQLLTMLFITISSFAVTANVAEGASKPSWGVWVQQLKQEAVAEGISASLFDNVFYGIKPDRKTIRLDRSQPVERMTYFKYRNTRGNKNRIGLGRAKYKKHRELIDQVAAEYGVSPCFITALWGIESSYGHFMGSFPVIKSLATLAYDDRRSAFFRKELLLALHILNDGHITNDRYKGEWAGGSGMPQFLPSSWHSYAVDYDGDGLKDIWTNHGDVFASIANYLVQNGWERDGDWGMEVKAPYGIDESVIGYDKKRPLSEWYAMGIRPAKGYEFPDENIMAALVHPYGGPYILAYNNFEVLLSYNYSTFYAGTAAHVADGICRIKR